MSATCALTDAPMKWGADCGGYKQRWRPGAFGDRPDIKGVHSFRVSEDEWEESEDGTVWRTIKRAEVLS